MLPTPTLGERHTGQGTITIRKGNALKQVYRKSQKDNRKNNISLKKRNCETKT